MSPGNPFISKSGGQGQGHEAQKRCRRRFLHSCECRLLLC